MKALVQILKEWASVPRLVRELHAALTQLQTQGEQIMATQATIVAQLNTLGATLKSIGDEVDKIGTETQTLLQKIDELQKALPPDASPELVAAVQAAIDQANVVAGKVQAVDALVPDAPAPTPAP